MKKTTLKDSLLLMPKTTPLPKSQVDVSETEMVVEKMHRPAAEKKTAASLKQTAAPKAAKSESTFAAIYSRSARKAARQAAAETAPKRSAQPPAAPDSKRITLDIPAAMHTAMKIKTFQAGITLREYLLGLAERDLFGK